MSFIVSSLENIFKVIFSDKPQNYWIWGLCSVKFMQDLGMLHFVVHLAMWLLWLWGSRFNVCGMPAVCGVLCFSGGGVPQGEVHRLLWHGAFTPALSPLVRLSNLQEKVLSMRFLSANGSNMEHFDEIEIFKNWWFRQCQNFLGLKRSKKSKNKWTNKRHNTTEEKDVMYALWCDQILLKML